MNVSRREWLAGAALVVIEPALAQHTHREVADEKKQTGAYRPKTFTEHEYKTLSGLCDLIIPADAGSPGALDAGAPEFIDLLAGGNSELAAIYTGGLAWLDNESRRRSGVEFIEAAPTARTALLDLIADSRTAAPELAPGVRFLALARKMVVDAFVTSKPGIAWLGYQGNGAEATFEVPAASLDYALKRSGLG